MKRSEGKTDNGIQFSEIVSQGSRDTLVLVMGYGGSRETWPRSFVASLAKSFRVIIFDNRGTGESIKPAEPNSYFIKDMSADLGKVVDQVGAREFHLLGYSLGGCIAQEFAGTNPQKIKKLILMSTTAGGDLYTSPPAEILESLANPKGETLWELYLSTWQHCMSLQALKEHEATLREIVTLASKNLTPRFALKGHLHAYQHFRSSHYLSAFKMPVLIITGEKDRLTPMANSQTLSQKIPHSKLWVIPNCEHTPHIEAKDLLLSEIFSFCDPKS